MANIEQPTPVKLSLTEALHISTYLARINENGGVLAHVFDRVNPGSFTFEGITVNKRQLQELERVLNLAGDLGISNQHIASGLAKVRTATTN